jgi:uncharacterized RDD family membrane protein YckC
VSYSTGGPSGPRAGFWRRFCAAFTDGLIIGIVGTILRLIIHGAGGELIAILIGFVYYVSLEGGASGQTLGKRLLGIRLIDFGNGGPIGYPRAVIRFFGRYVSAIVILLGYFWMLWDREKQCWHDKFAGDVVVPVSSYPVQGSGSSSQIGSWN